MGHVIGHIEDTGSGDLAIQSEGMQLGTVSALINPNDNTSADPKTILSFVNEGTLLAKGDKVTYHTTVTGNQKGKFLLATTLEKTTRADYTPDEIRHNDEEREKIKKFKKQNPSLS